MDAKDVCSSALPAFVDDRGTELIDTRAALAFGRQRQAGRSNSHRHENSRHQDRMRRLPLQNRQRAFDYSCSKRAI